MSKQKDDTPEEIDPSGEERKPKPGSYYYDDSTGYEIYDPEKEDDEEDDEENLSGEEAFIKPSYQIPHDSEILLSYSPKKSWEISPEVPF